jgi:hypothetical protein
VTCLSSNTSDFTWVITFETTGNVCRSRPWRDADYAREEKVAAKFFRLGFGVRPSLGRSSSEAKSRQTFSPAIDPRVDDQGRLLVSTSTQPIPSCMERPVIKIAARMPSLTSRWTSTFCFVSRPATRLLKPMAPRPSCGVLDGFVWIEHRPRNLYKDTVG